MIDPEKRAKIRDLHSQGVSQREISRRLSVHRGTVVRVLRGPPGREGSGTEELDPQDSAPLTRAAPPGEAPSPGDTGGGTRSQGESALDLVRGLLGKYRDEAERCAKTGDDNNAAKFARIATTLAPVLARLEKLEGADTLVIQRSAVAEARHRLRETIAALTREPPRCAACGRVIRASWADEAED